jgi:two-component system NtrC family response regulator
VIEKVEGNKSKAAKILEIDRKTLYTKLERYGLPA